MPLTLSGRHVALDTTEHPSLIDIAVGLSRQPRFGGHTTRWFSVLDHTMFGLYLIEAGAFAYRYDKRWWMLHDAHEALTGDVPTDLKGQELRSVQNNLDARIFDAFYPFHHGTEEAEKRIKEIDRRCFQAEAKVLMGEKMMAIAGTPFADDAEILKAKLASPLLADTRWVTCNTIPKAALGIPPLMERQEEHPLVRQWVSTMIDLM